MLLLLLAAAQAAPMPMVVAFDAAAPHLQAWWQPGALVVASGDEGGAVFRPLDRPGLAPRPSDLASWTLVSPAACPPAPDRPVTARLGSGPDAPQLDVAWDAEEPTFAVRGPGGAVAAVATLGRPARLCAVHLAQADAVPGVEILASWESPDGRHRGLTVLHIPEAAMPTASTGTGLLRLPSPTDEPAAAGVEPEAAGVEPEAAGVEPR